MKKERENGGEYSRVRTNDDGNIDDDEDQILTLAKITAKVEQQRHKAIFGGSNPDFDEIMAHIKTT